MLDVTKEINNLDWIKRVILTTETSVQLHAGKRLIRNYLSKGLKHTLISNKMSAVIGAFEKREQYLYNLGV